MKTTVAVRLHDHELLLLPGRTLHLLLHPVPPPLLQPLPLWVHQSLEPPVLNWGVVEEAWAAAALAQGSANAGDRLVAALGQWALSLEEGSLGSRVPGPVRTKRKEPGTTVKMNMRMQHDYRLSTPPLWNSRSTGLKRL